VDRVRIGELARAAGVTTKAVRYYEAVGLVAAERLPNGYRDYDEVAVRLVREIRALGDLGIRVEQARPFLDCLVAGEPKSDDCAAPLDVYRSVIGDLDGRIDELRHRRDALEALLGDAEGRMTVTR
jgi:DNA-binding transcriptional MerR regulator